MYTKILAYMWPSVNECGFENSALQGYYSASSGNLFSTIRDKL